jgi:hypothetical protein
MIVLPFALNPRMTSQIARLAFGSSPVVGSSRKRSSGEFTIPLKKKIDALAALAAAEQSSLEWGNIQTRQDSLDDVFVKLVNEPISEQLEPTLQEKTSKMRRRQV